MNRTCVLLCLCLLAAVPATASASEKTAAPARPYVETSYVIAPRSAGDFTLVRSGLDPDNRLAGPACSTAPRITPKRRSACTSMQRAASIRIPQ